MTDADQILRTADTILLVDWPSRDVPETLTRAGYKVFVKGGPEPDNYSSYVLRDGDVTGKPTGRRPERADLIYSHRPIGELPGVVAIAREVGASAVWHQSGRSGAGADDPRGCWMPESESRQARTVVESAGLTFLEEPYIADAVRRLEIQK